MLLCAATIYAGTVCFDIPSGAPTQRVATAIGAVLNLTDANGSPRPATQSEVSQFAAQHVRDTTQDYERRQNQQAYQPTPVPISVSPAPTPTPTP